MWHRLHRQWHQGQRVFHLPDDLFHQWRAAIPGLRLMFGWSGGVTKAAMVNRVFPPDSVDHDARILNPEGYRVYALRAALVIVISMFAWDVPRHFDLQQAGGRNDASESKSSAAA